MSQPELSFGYAVCENIASIAHVLDGNLRRDVIDDLTQESVVAVAFLFECPALRYIFYGRDPSALCQWLVDDLKRAAVRAFHNRMGDLAFSNVLDDCRAKFLYISIERARVLAMLEQIEEMATWFDDVCREIVHVDVAAVAGDHASRRVIQNETLSHIVERR